MALGDLEALSNKEAPPADEDGGSSSNSTATGGGRSNQHQHQEQRIKFSMSDEVLNGSGRNIKPPAAAAAASYAVPDTANANANGNANDNDNASADVTMPSPSQSTSTSMICLPHNAYFCDLRHEVFEGSLACGPPESGLVSKWRMKDRMKTGYVALFLCLNIGVDPPDVIKISPCARLECWIDPFSMPAPKAMDAIGKELERQYELWQPRARYKYQPDPTIEEVKKLCLHCRKNAKTERVLFHYNGHGVPKPTVNGEIWLFNKSYTQYIPLPVYDVESWLGTPSIYVFDCSAAGMIKNAFTERQDWGSSGASSSAVKDCILLGACGADETLPQSPEFPADLFTSCLTTPIKIALRWFCPRSLLRDSLELDMIDKIPGRQKERKTPLGELNWIFTAVTDTIAWNVLPRELFQRLFRQDLLVASLFRNFLLAERIMRTANCTPVSFPVLPPTHQHPMWDAWDMAAEICLSQLPALLANKNMEYQPSPFFTEQLTAFEVWLEHGSERKKPPEQLPIVLQVLLSQSHRCRALVLLGRFLDMGAWAVDLALSVGIFPYVLKLLQTTATELRQILVFIWTKILALDKSCQVDLVKDGGHQYFIRFLDSTDVYAEQRAMAAFVLAVIVDGHRRGQEACLQSNLINVCLRHMQPSPSGDGHSEPLLLQWLCLCLGKLWEGFPQAQLLGLQENASSVCLPLLSEAQPEVRASAVYALGNLFDTVTESPKEGLGYEEEFDDGVKAKAEQEILRNLLKVLSDGSPLVRAELAVALSRFVTGHNKHLKTLAAAYTKPPSNLGMSINPNSAQPMSSSYNSLSALANIRSPTSSLSNTGQYILPAYVISSNHGPVLRVASDSNTQGREERISTSSPIPSTIMQGSPSSDSSSQKSESRMSLTDGGNNGNVRVTHSKSLDNAVYAQCISAMYTLAKDPSPRVASLGMQLLHMIGVKVHVAKPSRQSSGAPHYRDAAGPSVPQIPGLARSFSWLDLNSGNNPLNIITPPVSPPTRQSYLTGMRRVCSLEFSPHMRSSEAGLADSLLASGGSAPERSTLLHSTIYNWSCGHFSRPLLYPVHDDEEALTRREDRERLVLERITKCRHSSLTKVSDQISYWDTGSEIGSKAVLLHPFVPIIVAGDDRETIRIWNYEEESLMNTFDNHGGTAGGLSKLCLVNELDDSMLLVASSDGSVRVWKDYMQRDNRRLATAWQSIQGHRPGARGVNAVVDWQQLTGFLFASGEISSIMVWDLDREQLACSIPTPTDICVTALSASQALGGQLVAGSQDGSVRLYDIRTKEMLACSSEPHVHGARVVGIDFQPGLDSAKIVSASIAGDIKFLDLRNSSSPYLEINTYKGSLSALAVHRHAPVIACGSNKQHIKVFDSRSGHQLSAIRYHNSFLVQKIGPVTSLSFHPYNILLAAGAIDSIVSIYAGENIQLR